jgi:hypothetical protein
MKYPRKTPLSPCQRTSKLRLITDGAGRVHLNSYCLYVAPHTQHYVDY